MKKSLLKSLVAGIAALGFSYSASAAPVPIPSDSVHQKMPRTVITTDGEVDDMNSVIRALLYSNEMDICGIVITSSTYHLRATPPQVLSLFAGRERIGFISISTITKKFIRI